MSDVPPPSPGEDRPVGRGTAVLVLAAGQGTRMRSSLPKVLHALAGRTMIERVLDTIAASHLPTPTLVLGYGADQVREVVGDRARSIDQGEQLGTGHAARVGLESLPRTIRRVVVIHGDEPLIPPDALTTMLARAEHAPIVLLTTHTDDTRDFGRVVRNESGHVIALEQRTADSGQRTADSEVNLGAYVFDACFLRGHLDRLVPHPPKGEYYLTDLVAIAADEHVPVEAVTLPGGRDVMGVNDLVKLEQATQVIYRRTNRRLMESGVTIVDTASTFIADRVRIAPDTIVRPFSIIEGDTTIGESCTIGPHTHIRDSQIGNGCDIISSTLQDSTVGNEVSIGPYAYLGPSAQVQDRAEIGSYAQIRRSTVGAGTRMHHFGYLGDATVGARVNIGAGTVTCNFDGRAKHQTVIEDDAFVGSDTMLRAPLTIGKGAATGAGSVVTHDVDPHTTVAGVPAREIRRQ